MCIGSITRMTCGHLHIIFNDRCEHRCKEPTHGPKYHDRMQQCGNCEASNQIYDIRDEFQKQYDDSMRFYSFAHKMGNVEELERIRTRLHQNAREENRVVSAVRRTGRSKARPRDSEDPVTMHPTRGHDPLAFIFNAQEGVYRATSIPREIKDPQRLSSTSASTSSPFTSHANSIASSGEPASPEYIYSSSLDNPGIGYNTTTHYKNKNIDPMHFHPSHPSFYDIGLDLDLDSTSLKPSLSEYQNPEEEVDSGLFFVGFHNR